MNAPQKEEKSKSINSKYIIECANLFCYTIPEVEVIHEGKPLKTYIQYEYYKNGEGLARYLNSKQYDYDFFTQAEHSFKAEDGKIIKVKGEDLFKEFCLEVELLIEKQNKKEKKA